VNVVCFLGSPRAGGNTETLLLEAVAGTGEDVRIFNLPLMDIGPCRSCGECEETGACSIDDDMREVYGALLKADRIILASPIYFMGLPAQLKAMIDRCQALWCGKYLLKRPIARHGRKGLLLLVGGRKKKAGIKCAGATATAFFRTVSVPEHTTLAYTGIDAKGDIRRHPTALAEAREAGGRLVQ
jgi:multimeric flavodoxin WrbA